MTKKELIEQNEMLLEGINIKNALIAAQDEQIEIHRRDVTLKNTLRILDFVMLFGALGALSSILKLTGEIDTYICSYIFNVIAYSLIIFHFVKNRKAIKSKLSKK